MGLVNIFPVYFTVVIACLICSHHTRCQCNVHFPLHLGPKGLIQRPSLRGSSNDRVSGSTAAPKVSPVQWTRTLRPSDHSNTFKHHGETKKKTRSWKLLIQTTFPDNWGVKTARTEPHLHEVLNQVLPAKSLQGLSPIWRPHVPGAGLRWLGFQLESKTTKVPARSILNASQG